MDRAGSPTAVPHDLTEILGTESGRTLRSVEQDVTVIIRAVERGDEAAAARLLPAVYGELRKLAEAKLRHDAAGRSLDATGLVHEAYLRLVGPEDQDSPVWNGRGHFFGAAAEAMRRILIDRARARGAVKRGGGARRLRLDAVTLADGTEMGAEILELDEALVKLAEEDPRPAELVKLRFFGGLSQAEAAHVLGISSNTADRDWAYARAWLFETLHPS